MQLFTHTRGQEGREEEQHMQEEEVRSPWKGSWKLINAEEIRCIIASKYGRLLHPCRLGLSGCGDDDVNRILLFTLCDQNTKILI